MSADGGDTLTAYLEADHARLDALLEDVRASASSAAFADARAPFETFLSGLDRHIAAEEELLFPAFERATGMTSGPTVVMRAEHVEIRRLLAAMKEALASGGAAAVERAAAALTQLLGAHNQKEERVLYPMTDRALGGGPAAAGLLERLRAMLAGGTRNA